MRAIVFVLFAVVVFPGAVQAQPGQTPASGPGDPAMAPPPYPPPPPPPPYAVPLTAEEQRLLDRGEISDNAHVGGAAVNWFLGFGLGQVVQGRWGETGWIFTLGEAGGIALIAVGASRLCFACESSEGSDGAGALIATGLISYVVFHAWSIIDAAFEPPNHNRKVRELKRRLGLIAGGAQRIVPYTSPVHGGGGTVGLTLRF